MFVSISQTLRITRALTEADFADENCEKWPWTEKDVSMRVAVKAIKAYTEIETGSTRVWLFGVKDPFLTRDTPEQIDAMIRAAQSLA